MATEYKLSYTASEINNKLGKIDELDGKLNNHTHEIDEVNGLQSVLSVATQSTNGLMSATDKTTLDENSRKIVEFTGEIEAMQEEIGFNTFKFLPFLPTDFLNGNINPDNFSLGEEYVYQNVSYAIRTHNMYFIHSQRFRVSINPSYQLFILGYNDPNDDYSVFRVKSTSGNAYCNTGDVTEVIGSRFVRFVVARKDLGGITPNDIEDINIILTPCSENELGIKAHSRKGAKLLPSVNQWTTVYDENGSGILETMFFAGDFEYVHRTKIAVYVDDEEAASLYGYLYELIGLKCDTPNDTKFGTDLFGKTGDKNGIYLNYKIPFYKRMVIKIANDTENSNPYVWFNCRTSKWHDFTVGGIKIPYGAKFHCESVMLTDVPSGQEFTLFETNKNGVILNTNLFAKGDSSSWYQEGMLRTYTNGSTTPQFLSSGLEDYFLGTYYFKTGTYYLNNAGCTYVNTNAGEHEIACYRIHNNDSLSFERGYFKITLRNNELNTEDATSILEPTTCTYRWYIGRYEW